MKTKLHLSNGYSVAKETIDLYSEMQNLNRAAIKHIAGIMKARMDLLDIKMFTFEPHIGIPDSQYGYKREDIYYFDNGRLIK